MGLIKSLQVDLADWPELIRDPGLKWEEVSKGIEKNVLHSF